MGRRTTRIVARDGLRVVLRALVPALVLAGVAAPGALAEPLPLPETPEPTGDRWRGTVSYVSEASGTDYSFRQSASYATAGSPVDGNPDTEVYPAAGGVTEHVVTVQRGPECAVTTTHGGGGPGSDAAIVVGRLSVVAGELEVGFPSVDLSVTFPLTTTVEGCGSSSSSDGTMRIGALAADSTWPRLRLDATGAFRHEVPLGSGSFVATGRLATVDGLDVYTGTMTQTGSTEYGVTSRSVLAWSLSCPVNQCVFRGGGAAEPACSDGVDNDGDGLIDLIDTGCAGAGDDSELGSAQCDDGRDNDADGMTDRLDAGCSSSTDGDERATVIVRVEGPGSVWQPTTPGSVCTETCSYDAAGAVELEAVPEEPHPDVTSMTGCPSRSGLTCRVAASPDRDVIIDVRFNPVLTYAPVVRFHRAERHWPMNPDRFVANSSLRWSNDRNGNVGSCTDDDVTKVAMGKVDARRLRSGKGARYRHRYCYRWATVRNGQVVARGERTRRFSTADKTSPSELGRRTPKQADEGRWGFYLDLRDSERRGAKPRDDGYSNAPPMMVEYRPRKYVVYWFFFGQNHVRLGLEDYHEGDWERMAVRLDEHDRATHAAYWQHYCEPTVKYGSLLTWAQMRDRGRLNGGTHPDAYLALGAHASYPDDGGADGRTVTPCQVENGINDHHGGGGVVWETWQRGLYGFSEVTRKPWYGFGGGWGHKTGTGSNEFWGPLGPGPLKPPVPRSWR